MANSFGGIGSTVKIEPRKDCEILPASIANLDTTVHTLLQRI